LTTVASFNRLAGNSQFCAGKVPRRGKENRPKRPEHLFWCEMEYGEMRKEVVCGTDGRESVIVQSRRCMFE